MNRFSKLRKLFFWAHLAIGLGAGLVIFLMAGSGLLLSFERQITERLDTYKIHVSPESQRLSISELHGKILAADAKSRPTGVLIRPGADSPVVFQFGREKSIFVHPYTGEILGPGAVRTRNFFKQVTSFHRWLALSGKAKEVGQSINSAAACAFLFLIFSGLIIWIPKRITRRGLAAISRPRLNLQGRARDWNWHNALGIWSALPLIFIVSTGLLIAYPWARQLLYQAFGETLPTQQGGKKNPPPVGPENLPSGLDAAIAAVTFAKPNWQQAQFSFPKSAEPLKVFVAGSHRGRPDLRSEFTVDLATAQLLSTKDFSSDSPAKRAMSWGRWIHTGEAGGWIGQSIAAFACVATLVLIYSGFALSWRRFFRKEKTA